MRLPSFAAVVFVSTLAVLPLSAQNVTVLQDVRVIDGTGAAPLEHATLVLANGHIQRVCLAKQSCKFPKNAVAADLSGKTVMPGLITAHAHVALMNDRSEFDAAEYTEANVVKQLEQYERYGVTTIVSLGLNRDLVYDVRAKQHEGQVDGATLLTVGRGFGTLGGVPPFKTAPDQIYRATTPEEARKDVDETAAHHADLIKIWIDSAHGHAPEMKDEVVRAIIDEAHKNHIRVAAHVYALADAKRIVNEGVDILAHSIRDAQVDQELIDLLKTKGTWYIPTLTVDETAFVYADHPELTQSKLFIEATPAPTVEILSSEAYRNKTENDPGTAGHRQDFRIAKQNLKRLYDAGVKIGFGTDSGAIIGRIPGYSEHRELELMVSAGLTPLEAIACATSHNAELLRLDTGIVRTGKFADLIVVDGDPSAHINDSTHMVAVFHRGKRIAPPQQ